jgi:hypothetical protein
MRLNGWNRTSGLVVPDHALSLLSYIQKLVRLGDWNRTSGLVVPGDALCS